MKVPVRVLSCSCKNTRITEFNCCIFSTHLNIRNSRCGKSLIKFKSLDRHPSCAICRKGKKFFLKQPKYFNNAWLHGSGRARELATVFLFFLLFAIVLCTSFNFVTSSLRPSTAPFETRLKRYKSHNENIHINKHFNLRPHPPHFCCCWEDRNNKRHFHAYHKYPLFKWRTP